MIGIGIGLQVGEFAQFVALGRQSDPMWLFAGRLLQSRTYLCAAAVSGSALRRAGWPLPLPVLARLSLAKLFADHAIPSAGVSGGVLFLRETTRWPRLELLPPVRGLLVMLREAAPEPLHSPALVAQGTLLQAAIVVLDGLTLWTLLHAGGVATASAAAVAALVAANAAAALSPIPAGLGTFEGTAVAVLILLDTPIAAALAATLLLRGFALWLPMLPGLWLAQRLLAPHDDHLPARPRGRPRPGATHE